MTDLAVIGNVSIDHTRYPDGTRRTLIGGAALHIARAAASAGITPTPVAVLGQDLALLTSEPRLADLDWSGARILPGPSARFTLTYDAQGRLADVETSHHVAHSLTEHALTWVADHPNVPTHVCCRTPLDASKVLELLAEHGTAFSLDFYSSSARQMLDAARPHLSAAAAIIVNREEASILAELTPLHLLPALVVTDGPGPVRLYRCGELAAEVVPPTASPAELTGAGDTLTGSLLAGRLLGLADQAALDGAVATATAHVRREPLDLAI